MQITVADIWDPETEIPQEKDPSRKQLFYLEMEPTPRTPQIHKGHPFEEIVTRVREARFGDMMDAIKLAKKAMKNLACTVTIRTKYVTVPVGD